MKKTVFCAGCQVDTEHDVTVVKNPHGHQEIIFSCGCCRQWKLPADLPKEQLAELIAAHKAHNIGQVPAEADVIPADHPALKALEEI